MAVITLGNVYSTVTELTKVSLRSLRKDLCVKSPGHEHVPSFKKGFWDGNIKFYEIDEDTKALTFPTGLLSKVAKSIKLCEEPFDIIDNRESIEVEVPDDIELKHSELGSITLRDYQYDSVSVALNSSRGIINVATNGGKTEIACGIIQQILPHIPTGKRIVFFTHSKEIFSQSKKRIEERLGMEVGAIGDGKWNERRVTVVMIPTISKYLELPKKLPKSKKLNELKAELDAAKLAYKADKSYKSAKDKAQADYKAYEAEQWEKLTESVDRTTRFLENTIGFLADEAHHSSAKTWYDLFMKLDNAYFRYGLTGTVDDSNPLNVMRLLASTGRIIKKVSNEFLIERGYSAKPTIFMLGLGDIESITSVNYMLARREGIILSGIRNRIFANKIHERANSGKQCLIIVNETEHGEIMLDLLKGNGYTVEFTHGDKTNTFREEVLDRLKTGDLQVLIATTILDEGVDVSGINSLFLMAGGKSMRQVLQRIGRGLRKKADGSGLEVYDSLDYHNEYLTEHTLDRVMTYKEEGFDIQKIPAK
ncbi:helicase [Exiguobacterium phage vB_EalM-132]|nr:helicase [Exiguobacterium phage vB_EalM-132]